MVKKFAVIFGVLNAGLFCAVFRKPVKMWKRGCYDCAVVCGYHANIDGTPSSVMRTRVEKAAELWKAGKVRFLILSGGPVFHEYVEADVMQEYARELGIPEECLLTEPKALCTYDNLRYAKELMEAHGLQNCVVVTNAWHLRKADHYARKAGLDYVMCPTKHGEGMGKVLLRCVSTNLHMYRNLFRGYY